MDYRVIGPVCVIHGDCLDVLPLLAPESVDTLLSDPPYGLSFMGRDWDHDVPGTRFWREAMRVCKPRASGLVFGGTRKWHRLAVALEDAGWTLRDTLMWLHGQGFPKGQAIDKAIDALNGDSREVVGRHRRPNGNNAGLTLGEGWQPSPALTAPGSPESAAWEGWKTQLKPAWEPILWLEKPSPLTYAANALEHGVAGLWVDGCRVATIDNTHRRNNVMGYGGNVQSFEGGGHSAGRYPANLILDDTTAPMLDAQSGESVSRSGMRGVATGYSGLTTPDSHRGHDDRGGASRFFYCAKASPSERDAGLMGGSNTHPTVKPLALMRYLARLSRTPTGGCVLDPFAGSGTTGVACVYEGRAAVLIERDRDHWETACRRIAHAVEEVQGKGAVKLDLEPYRAPSREEAPPLLAWLEAVQVEGCGEKAMRQEPGAK